jgi:lysosomal Pro-X carboxypeptidase
MALVRGAALALLFVSIYSNPGSRNCSTHWFRQPLDHFSFSPPPPPSTGFWLQRYLVHDSFFNPRNGTVFFYTGNEGDVTLYADHCGLMWENAAQFNALLIFAEHRFYGLSQPFPGANATQHYGYLSSQLALADYANLLREVLPALGAAASPVVAFGGSYGGVLAATFRASYPGSVDGAIASSAPLRAFPGQEPPWDSALYYQVPTRDASVEGGSAAACAPNVRAAFPLILAAGATPAGRAELGAAFRTCAPLNVSDDAVALAFWVRAAWDTLAMGSYPYPSNYLTGGGKVLLPAYPVRVACGALAAPLTGVPLLEGVREAIAVLYNASRDLPCFDVDVNPYTHPAAPYDGIWDFQQCTEMQPDSQWFSSTGVSDMFFFVERNLTFLEEHCRAAWGVAPAWTWISTRYNLPSFRGASNIAFSNGLMGE